MCGLAGIYNLDENPEVDRMALRRAVSRMDARGPDDRGFFEAPGLLFGHRRLAVIDPDAGQQPMTLPGSGHSIIFNGEIYNHRELRASLESHGHVFRTRSDTEVLLHACVQWGAGALERLNGMFAFAFYNPDDRSLLLARDHLGIKPLFYALGPQRIIFASSMAALLCLYEGTPRLDQAALTHYLTTVRTTLGTRTLVQDMRTLLPGTCLLLDRHHPPAPPRRYWALPVIPPSEKQPVPIEHAAEQARARIEEAVSLQLISDVPLGGFLSGGLDSAILAAVASRQTRGHYHAYGVGYDSEGYHEWAYMREAAARYRMSCREIHLRPEQYPSDWLYLIRQKGLPLSTPNEVPIYHLARALREEYVVALSGEGADEIFGGYALPYFSAHDYERASRTPPAQADPIASMIQRLYGVDHLPDPVSHHFLLNSWMPARLRDELLGRDTQHRPEEEMLAWYREQYARVAACSPLDQRMHVHAQVNLEGLLSRVDSSTMAASVEARVPYTDHRLAEWLFSLPDTHKVDWRHEQARQRSRLLHVLEMEREGLLETKRLLRMAFREQVPPSILERPKMSFPVPVFDWLGSSFASTVRAWIAESTFAGTLFDAPALERLLANAQARPNAMALWPVANLCLWQHTCGIES